MALKIINVSYEDAVDKRISMKCMNGRAGLGAKNLRQGRQLAAK